MIEVPQVKPFYIGKVEIPNPVILAPMAGITDIVFRNIIKNLGAGLVYTEMLSSEAIHYRNPKTLKIAEINPDEKPVSAQIFGSNPARMAEAAAFMQNSGASIIDINLGCSVPKVIKNNAGATLCRDLPLLARVLKTVVKSVSIPVTIKIRKGWSDSEITAFEVCRIARETGVAAVAIHGRTSRQAFSGEADWDFIERLADEGELPVIGNGDILTARQAVDRLKNTNCVAVMIGRGAYYNPYIFRDILDLLQGKEIPPGPTIDEIRDLMLFQLDKTIERFGEEFGVKRMRKFIAWYTRSLPHSTRFRDVIFRQNSKNQVVEAVRKYFNSINTIKDFC